MSTLRVKGSGIGRKKPRLKTPKTLSERVRQHYRDKFIEFPDAPVDDDGKATIPQLPPDITVVTSQDLGRLHQRFKYFLDYVVGVQTMRDIDKLASANDAAFEMARQVLDLEDSGLTAKGKEAQAFTDPEAAKKREAALERKAQYVFLSNRIKQLEGDLKLISREMTRRENEIERAKQNR